MGFLHVGELYRHFVRLIVGDAYFDEPQTENGVVDPGIDPVSQTAFVMKRGKFIQQEEIVQGRGERILVLTGDIQFPLCCLQQVFGAP